MMPVSAAANANGGKAQFAALATEAPVAATGDGTHFALGPLGDEDLRDAVYQALVGTVAGSKSLGDGSEATTELGDNAAFSYNIVKLSQGKDDISGDGGYADSMDVEVTGWYKRTLHGSSAEAEAACTSFDALGVYDQTRRRLAADPSGGNDV